MAGEKIQSHPAPPPPSQLRSFVSGVGIGTVFGFALEKSKVFHPYVISSQMHMTNFIMLKVFLSATATGLLLISALEKQRKIPYLTRKKSSLGLGLVSGYGGNIVGGLILGMGITVAKACPGTIYAQLGTGIPGALAVMAGSLLGALSFGYIHTAVGKLVEGFVKDRPSPTLDRLFKTSTISVSLVGAGLFAAVVAAFEYAIPWQGEAAEVVSNFSAGEPRFSIFSGVWPPEFAGVLIGLLQVPSHMLAGAPLGSSSSFVTIASRVSCLMDSCQEQTSPYLASFRSNLYQPGLMAGVVLGAMTSAFLGGASYSFAASQDTVTPLQGFIGGLLLIYGARIAGGCTSGHGISGIARLSLASLISTGCMFAGGMGLALFM